jgi:hypothetical protein
MDPNPGFLPNSNTVPGFLWHNKNLRLEKAEVSGKPPALQKNAYFLKIGHFFIFPLFKTILAFPDLNLDPDLLSQLNREPNQTRRGSTRLIKMFFPRL